MSRRLSSGLRANSRRLWRWHRGYVWSVAAAGNTLAVVLLVRAPRPVLPLGMPGFWLLVGCCWCARSSLWSLPAATRPA